MTQLSPRYDALVGDAARVISGSAQKETSTQGEVS
jgi:hypothetical protein